MNKSTRKTYLLFTLTIIIYCFGQFIYADIDEFTGVWIGSHCGNKSLEVFWDELTIEKKGNILSANVMIRQNLGQAEYNAILAGKNISSPYTEKEGNLYFQEMEVTISGDSLILKPSLWNILYGYEGSEPKPVIFNLKVSGENRLAGFSTLMEGQWVFGRDSAKNNNLEGFSVNKDSKVSVLFNRKGKEIFYPPLLLEKGKIIKIGCLDAPGVEYSCYIPKGYNHEKPVPVMVNDSPIGNASPFAVNAAEKLGWLSVGLPGEYDETGFLVIRDIYGRFRIAERGLYLIGFSEGARRCVYRSTSYRGELGGIIDIDMYSIYTIGCDPEVPVCCLIANKESIAAEWMIENLGKNHRSYRWHTCFVYNAGHSWGPIALHERAVYWLAKIRSESAFFNSSYP